MDNKKEKNELYSEDKYLANEYDRRLLEIQYLPYCNQFVEYLFFSEDIKINSNEEKTRL